MIDKIRFSLTMVTSTIFDSNSTRAYGWVLDNMVAGGIFDFIFMGGGPRVGVLSPARRGRSVIIYFEGS